MLFFILMFKEVFKYKKIIEDNLLIITKKSSPISTTVNIYG